MRPIREVRMFAWTQTVEDRHFVFLCDRHQDDRWAQLSYARDGDTRTMFAPSIQLITRAGLSLEQAFGELLKTWLGSEAERAILADSQEGMFLLADLSEEDSMVYGWASPGDMVAQNRLREAWMRDETEANTFFGQVLARRAGR